MSVFEIILSVATALLGGTNILQLVNNRQLRRKMAAEAEQSEVASLQLIIKGNTDEIARLQKRLDDYTERYDLQRDRYDALRDKYDELADQLRNLQNKFVN